MNGRNPDSGFWQIVAFAVAVLLCFYVLPGNAAGLPTPADGSLSPLELREHPVYVVVEDSYEVPSVDQMFEHLNRN